MEQDELISIVIKMYKYRQFLNIMSFVMRIFILFILIPFYTSFGNEVLLYQKKPVGPYANFNPISYYFNTAFDTIQNPNYFNQENYLKNHELVLERTFNIRQGIKDGGGVKNLLKNEILGLRAMPNYFLHLLGSGYDFRLLGEWFQTHQFKNPYVWAIALSYVAHLGNEALESSNKKDINAHDHIADLLFFDLISKFIYMNDDYVSFFKNSLGMSSWPYQPFINQDGLVENTGSNFILRPKIRHYSVRPFIHIGMQLLLGLSFPYYDYTLNIATGPAFTDPLQDKSRLALGIYLDQNESLMGSLIINGTDRFRARLNIYPGVLSYNGITTGIMLANSSDDEWIAGLNLNYPIGLAFRR
jgi:hypothetical protein